jgi:hypothetical protein
MRTLVLENIWGGLGDHLFMSHLPRIAKQTGAYDRVFLSNRSLFRNDEYRQLIWESNPYLDGFCDEPGVCPIFTTVPPGTNLLDQIMLELGMDDGQRFHEPELYHLPAPNPDYVSKSLYDPNFVSGVGDIRVSRVERILVQRRISIDMQFKPRDGAAAISGPGELITPNISEYCRAIVSCRQFVCLTSGGATLAAALKKPSLVFYGYGQKPMFQHSRLHEYVYAGPSLAWARDAKRAFARRVRGILDGGLRGSP